MNSSACYSKVVVHRLDRPVRRRAKKGIASTCVSLLALGALMASLFCERPVTAGRSLKIQTAVVASAR